MAESSPSPLVELELELERFHSPQRMKGV